MKQVGNVFVDSGQIMIGDPCYINKDWSDEFATDKPGEFSYAGACTATLSEQGYGVLGGGTGFACSTRWGDGNYPVFAEFDHTGRVISLTVHFDWDPEDDEDEDEDY
jgi:hypothetical protein